MKVRVKVNGKWQQVECYDRNCPNRSCFDPGKTIHIGHAIDGSSTSWQEKNYSCVYRDYHGCPDFKEGGEA